MSQTQKTNGRYDGITFSNTAVESVLRDIRDGSSDELVKSFFDSRTRDLLLTRDDPKPFFARLMQELT